MTSKKKYQVPAFEVIKLKSLSRLCCGSPDPAEEDGDGEEHDQNQYP